MIPFLRCTSGSSCQASGAHSGFPFRHFGENHPFRMVKKPLENPPPDLPPKLIPLFGLELNPIPSCLVSPEAGEGQKARQPPVPGGRSLGLRMVETISILVSLTVIFGSFFSKAEEVSAAKTSLRVPETGLSTRLGQQKGMRMCRGNRPASVSETDAKVMRLAEPVRRYCPAAFSRQTPNCYLYIFNSEIPRRLRYGEIKMDSRFRKR
jgi:hypothetical protein